MNVSILTFLALLNAIPKVPYTVVDLDSQNGDEVNFDASANSHVAYDEAGRTFYVSADASKLPEGLPRIVRGIQLETGVVGATILHATNGKQIDSENARNDILDFTAARLSFSQALDFDTTGIAKMVDKTMSWETVIGSKAGKATFSTVSIGKATLALSAPGHINIVDAVSAKMTIVPIKAFLNVIDEYGIKFEVDTFIDGSVYGCVNLVKLEGYDETKAPIATRVYADDDVMATACINNYGWAFKVVNSEDVVITHAGEINGIWMQTMGMRGLVQRGLVSIVADDETVRLAVSAEQLQLEGMFFANAFSKDRVAA